MHASLRPNRKQMRKPAKAIRRKPLWAQLHDCAKLLWIYEMILTREYTAIMRRIAGSLETETTQRPDDV